MKGCNNHSKEKDKKNAAATVCEKHLKGCGRWMFSQAVSLIQAMYSVVMGCEVPKEKMDTALEDLNQSLKLLEEKFLQDKPFIVGDKISMADLVALEEIMQVHWSS